MCVCVPAVGTATASAAVVKSHSSIVTANRTRSSVRRLLGYATRACQREPGHHPVHPRQRLQRIVVVVSARPDIGARPDHGLDATILAQPLGATEPSPDTRRLPPPHWPRRAHPLGV